MFSENVPRNRPPRLLDSAKYLSSSCLRRQLDPILFGSIALIPTALNISVGVSLHTFFLEYLVGINLIHQKILDQQIQIPITHHLDYFGGTLLRTFAIYRDFDGSVLGIPIWTAGI